MGNPRYPWWGYIKNILKKYPNVSPDEKTAQRWHADFIRTVAVNFKCDSLMEDGKTYDPEPEEI